MKDSYLLDKLEAINRKFSVLEKENTTLKKDNTYLKKENAHLKELLSKYQNPKNSSNSSVPPSKDENRLNPNQSLRKPSGKKPGGQKGHEGRTLEMSATPDKIIELVPKYCTQCGNSLTDKLVIKKESRQTLDVPPVKPIYVEYQSYSKVCDCGCENSADFPKGVDAPISYGRNTKTLISYLHTRHYLPFRRMKELLGDVFSLPISEGGIHCLLNHFAEKATPVYETIKKRIKTSAVIGSDETGAKVNGQKHWFWTWQTPNLTYIAHSSNRAGDTINKEFPKGFPNSTLVHDGWKPQLNTSAKNHQICLPHLQRRLKYLNEKYPKNTWSKQFLKLLYDSLNLKKQMSDRKRAFDNKRIEIIQRLKILLEKPPDKKDKELYTFYKRMGRERQHLFTFLFMAEVPPDNNSSERAIRNVKVKQKISGQFKIEQAAKNFAKIRSVIDTTIKNGCNVLDALTLIAKSEFQMPSPTD